MLTVLVLLLKILCAESACSSLTLCISNSNASTECQDSSVIADLSNIPEYAKSCRSIDMQVTNGNHILYTILAFSDMVQNITIYGSQIGMPSTVICQNQAGIQFSEKKYNRAIYFKYIHLKNCSREDKATLHFMYVTYYSLESVHIEDSSHYSIYAYQCNNHTIFNSTFTNSRRGHIQIRFHKRCAKLRDVILIAINSSHFYGGKYGINIEQKSECHYGLSISNSKFSEPTQQHIVVESKDSLKNPVNIIIESSRFFLSPEVGIHLNSNGNNFSIRISNCSFTDNYNGALQINQATKIAINSSKFVNNWVTAVYITHQRKSSMNTSILNTIFSNNSRALHLFREHGNAKRDSLTEINNCTFQNNNLSNITSAVTIDNGEKINHLLVTNSLFEKNYGIRGNCSCFMVTHSDNVVFENVIFSSNACSGMTITSSRITIQNWVNVTRSLGQLGGALQMLSWTGSSTKFSSIILKKNARMVLTENTAKLYGGGIYTDETCDSNLNESRHCFFQTDTNGTAITLAGNKAELGGDAIFGGCLTQCYINNELINVRDPDNIIYTIISLQEKSSPAAFGEPPHQVAFCSNSSFAPTCTGTHRLKAYRGEIFFASLAITGRTSCFPTVGFMQARLTEPIRAQLEDLDGQESYKKSKKFCDQYKYSVSADLSHNSVSMELIIHRDLPSNYAPARLTVVFDDCPPGYNYNTTERKCLCSDLLKSQRIECVAGTRLLKVSPLTWIGEIQEKPAISTHCQYCHTEGDTVVEDLTNTAQLCTGNRSGILCGQCSGKNSLLLGGHQCGDCYKSFYKGFLLVLGFTLIGAAMVLLLLRLNLTVSTGLVNGLILYSNIVYASSDVFLPASSDGSSIDTVVAMLFTILAWINLDFGISACFFDGYNIYVSTWMQFVFPLYVLLLIVALMLASRYSGRISRFATSNTVSVLATLLVLSYSKLFKASIETFLFTNVVFLNDSTKHRVWVLDGNILYLHGKHVPLFIMSLLTILLYILPLTLLIVLGPIILSRPCYRRFKILSVSIPFVRPLLKAFYGSYRQKYEYWPGILLLARLVSLLMFIYHKFDVRPIKLVTVSSLVIVLVSIWISLSKGDIKSKLVSAKYLDMLILLNLGIFSVFSLYISTYTEKRIRSQQVLAVVMVGGVLALICCISTCKLVCRISIVRKFCRKLVGTVRIKGFHQLTIEENSTSSVTSSVKDLDTITHTSIVLNDIPKELGKS